MSTATEITTAMQAAMNDESKGLEVLKQELTENGFKHTSTAANIMLTTMRDMGLPDDAYTFYATLAMTKLPLFA